MPPAHAGQARPFTPRPPARFQAGPAAPRPPGGRPYGAPAGGPRRPYQEGAPERHGPTGTPGGVGRPRRPYGGGPAGAARPAAGRPRPAFGAPPAGFGRPPAPAFRPVPADDEGPADELHPPADVPQAPELFRPDEEELVAGRRPVEEAFVARRPAHRLLIVPQRRQALERIVLHAISLRIPVIEVEGGTLTALAGFDGHQGVALAVAPRQFADLDQILARAIERGEPPLVLVLDSLEDPQNVGTLLRSAEAAGAHGVIFPTRRQAPLSAAAIKASAGATEHLLLAPVDDLAGAMADLHVRGLRIAGAEADAPLTARQADLRGPLAIVIGSEGHGLSPAVRRRCDLAMRIPLRGAVGSLNAAVAGSILLFEAVAQRDATGGGVRQPAPVQDAPPAPSRAEAPADARVEPAHDTSGPADALEAGVPAEAADAADPVEAAHAAALAEAPDAELLPGEAPATAVARPRPARARRPSGGA